MKPGTAKLLPTYYFILQQILERCSAKTVEGKRRLNNIVKDWYCREYNLPHASLKDFEREELNDLINKLLIEIAVEYGIYLQQPNDPDFAEDMCLAEYLEHLDWAMDKYSDSFVDTFKTIPKGFVLIKDINALKQPDSNRLMLGTILYVRSDRNQSYYKKVITKFTPINKLKSYINKQLVYGPKLKSNE